MRKGEKEKRKIRRWEDIAGKINKCDEGKSKDEKIEKDVKAVERKVDEKREEDKQRRQKEKTKNN